VGNWKAFAAVKGLSMSKRNDDTYFATRAQQERRMAEEATDARIAALHWELASRYEELAGERDSSVRELRTG
jgi:hypothetical protein